MSDLSYRMSLICLTVIFLGLLWTINKKFDKMYGNELKPSKNALKRIEGKGWQDTPEEIDERFDKFIETFEASIAEDEEEI